jgi:predicted P-loop ATPase
MKVAHDAFRDEIMYSEEGGASWVSFKDADYTRLRIALERCGFPPPGKENTRDAVLLVAEQNRFDSAQLWLSGLVWDGVPRIARFLSTHMGADDTPYTRAVGRYIWSALAGRVIQPGCKADMAVILVGPQGLRKSSGVAAIAPAPEFFTEISFGEKEDDLSRKMRGRLVAELAELKGLRGKDSESIKAWMTKQYEDWTPKFREFSTVFPRRLLCFGTTNQDEFLVDETGNRRWLPARVLRQVDVAAIKRDCLQLWAEAAEAFHMDGVDFREAEELAKAEHDAYMMRDPWEPTIARWLDTPDEMTEQKPADRDFLRTHEVLQDALRKDAKSCTRADEMRVSAILRGLGFTRKRMRIDGGQPWVFVLDLA